MQGFAGLAGSFPFMPTRTRDGFEPREKGIDLMLSDAQTRAAKPRDRSYKLFDTHQLFLLVKTGGSKLCRLNCEIGGAITWPRTAQADRADATRQLRRHRRSGTRRNHLLFRSANVTLRCRLHPSIPRSGKIDVERGLDWDRLKGEANL